MPEGFGYGGDEVKATTHNKTVKKKATSQNPPQSTVIERSLGETPQQQKFRKQVKSQVGATSTQKDVLKAAGLSGTGISSTPPPETRKGLGMRPDEMTSPRRREGTQGRVAGIRDKQKTDEVDRALQQRKHPGMQKMVDAMRAAGLSDKKINQYLSVQYSAGPNAERRAERREKFLRRRAAEKYGTPP